MKIPKISTESKQTLLGATIGSLTVDLETALSYFVPAYPQPLKDKIAPWLPRNGTLVANVAPAGIAWAYTRKRGSAKMQNIKMGTFLYDFPKLLDNIGYNIAYQMGVPALRVPLSTQSPPIKRAQATASAMMLSGGKYALKASAPTSMGGGIGKYR